MNLHEWLEKAYAEGRISIAEALNVQRSTNPYWRILIAEKQFHYKYACHIIAIAASQRLPLSTAITEFQRSGKPKRPVQSKPPKPPPAKLKRPKKKQPRIRGPKPVNTPSRGGTYQNVWNRLQQTGYAWRPIRA